MRVAMLSLHSHPRGRLGSRDTGGMSVCVREAARALGAAGHEVDVFTAVRASGMRRVSRLAPGSRIVHLQPPKGSRLDKEGLFDTLPYLFDQLQAFGASSDGGYQVVHSHYWLSGVVGCWASRSWGIPHVATFHTLGAAKSGPGWGEREPERRLSAENEIARLCDRVICPSPQERERVIRLCAVGPEKVSVVACGVDSAHFRPGNRDVARRALNLAPWEDVVVFVGRFDPVKGIDAILEALPRLQRPKAARLLLVGGDGATGPVTVRLREKARRLGVGSSVRFEGPVDHRAMPTYYQAADVAVLPSHYESFGLVVLEALACGTPVVATPVGIAPQIIRSGHNGELAQDASPQTLARALDAVLAEKGRLPRDRIRATVADFSWSRAASDLAAIYGEVEPQDLGRAHGNR